MAGGTGGAAITGGSVVWILDAESGNFNQAIIQAKGQAEGLGKTIQTQNKANAKSFDDTTKSLAAFAAAYLALNKVSQTLKDSIKTANDYQAAFLGLGTVANAFGTDANAATDAARSLAQDGLMSVQDAAVGLKNLLAAGFSLDQAINLMNGFKDSAAFSRQAALGFGEAIRGATEGIKNGNSTLVDNAGITKNLSVIIKEMGKSQQDLMNVQSDASVRTALYTGLLKEMSVQTGDAARLSDTAAGADARLSTAMTNLQAEVGNTANALRKDLTFALADFIQNNQQAVITVGTGVATMIAFAGGAYVAVKAVNALKLALTSLAKHPAIAILTLTAGLLASLGVSALMDSLDEADTSAGNLEANLSDLAPSLDSASSSANKLAKQLARIDESVQKANDDYRYQLAQLVKQTEDNIAQTRKQLDEENKSYQKAYSDRFNEYSKSLLDETEEHDKQVSLLTTQIDFLKRYNNTYNRDKLSNLQFALAKENAQYQAQTSLLKTQYDEDLQALIEQHNAKLQSYQDELSKERSLLERHAEDVASIRDVMLLDEIDSLKKSRDEQLKSLQQQRADALDQAGQTNDALLKKTQEYLDKLNKQSAEAGKKAGENLGNSWLDGLEKKLEDRKIEMNKNTKNPFIKYFTGGDVVQSYMGGPVRAGNPYLVGENPDGSINKTTELFIPNQSGRIMNAGDLQDSIVGAGGSTPLGGDGAKQDITINLELTGVFASSPAEQRAAARQMLNRINEELRAKSLPQIGVA